MSAQDLFFAARAAKQYDQIRKTAKEARKAEKKRQKQARKQATENIDAPAEAPVAVDQPKKFDLLHGKWMKFGGGFYGVVAFYTYILVELPEVRDFFVSLARMFEHGLVSLVIQFFIESLKNFIAAIAWPAYWLSRIQHDQWLWILGAYAGYWIGSKAAFRFSSEAGD